MLSWYIIAIHRAVYRNSLSAVDAVVSRHIFDRWRNLRSLPRVSSKCFIHVEQVYLRVCWVNSGHPSAAVCPAVWHCPCTEGGKLICLDFWVGLCMWVVLYTQGKQFLYGDTCLAHSDQADIMELMEGSKVMHEQYGVIRKDLFDCWWQWIGRFTI